MPLWPTFAKAQAMLEKSSLQHTYMDDADLLNVTSPGMHDAEETVAAGPDADETSLEQPADTQDDATDPDFVVSTRQQTARPSVKKPRNAKKVGTVV